jgi:hypothetical protein
MKLPPLATLLSTFFLRYLAVERGVSPPYEHLISGRNKAVAPVLGNPVQTLC